jgi:hypothetical protein
VCCSTLVLGVLGLECAPRKLLHYLGALDTMFTFSRSFGRDSP